jgi:hypothetical protein
VARSKTAKLAARGLDDPELLAAMEALHADDPGQDETPPRDASGRFLPRAGADPDAPASHDGQHDPDPVPTPGMVALLAAWPPTLSIDERSRLETEANLAAARAAAATPAWMTRTLAAEAALDQAVAAHKALLARLSDPDADDSDQPSTDDLVRAATEVTRCERLISRARVLDQRADDRERVEAAASFRQRQAAEPAGPLAAYHEALAALVAAADAAADARERVNDIVAELRHEAYQLRQRWPDTPGRDSVASAVNPLGNDDGLIDKVRSAYDEYRPPAPAQEAAS